MWEWMYGLIRTQALHAAASLGIADQLAKRPMTPDALAVATESHGPSLSRLLRFLASSGLLASDDEGRYSLTAAGEMLRSDSPLSARAGAVFYGSPFIWTAWGNLLETVRTGRTAFEVAHGQPLWDYLAVHAEDLRINTDFMTEMARPRLGGATQGYEFPPTGRVVDVGGGEGAMLVAILRSNPGLRGLLLELPEVALKARAAVDAAGLADRCAVQEGSFFEAVPSGGDVYVLSNIMHDWDDEHCIQILGNCRRAMQKGAKLLVIDVVLPDKDPPFTLAALDLQMMVVVGGKQRTESEMRDILEWTGFRLSHRIPPGLTEAEAV
jgi:hypothetical protein